MSETLSTLLTALFVCAILSTFALVGVVTVKKADEPLLRLGGYAVAVVFGFLALTVPLLIIFTYGAYTTSEGNSDVACWNFPDVEMAQAFYDVAQVHRPGFYDPAFDPDGNGVACEQGIAYRP